MAFLTYPTQDGDDYKQERVSIWHNQASLIYEPQLVNALSSSDEYTPYVKSRRVPQTNWENDFWSLSSPVSYQTPPEMLRISEVKRGKMPMATYKPKSSWGSSLSSLYAACDGEDDDPTWGSYYPAKYYQSSTTYKTGSSYSQPGRQNASLSAHHSWASSNSKRWTSHPKRSSTWEVGSGSGEPRPTAEELKRLTIGVVTRIQ